MVIHDIWSTQQSIKCILIVMVTNIVYRIRYSSCQMLFPKLVKESEPHYGLHLHPNTMRVRDLASVLKANQLVVVVGG